MTSLEAVGLVKGEGAMVEVRGWGGRYSVPGMRYNLTHKAKSYLEDHPKCALLDQVTALQ